MAKEILIVDDDNEIVALLQKILEGMGFLVSSADNVDDGMSLLEARAPHLVLLDINLTGSEGFDFLHAKRMNPVFSEIPVVMLSIESSKQSISKAMAFGASDYMVKPIEAKQVVRKVKKLLREIESPSYNFLEQGMNGPPVDIECVGDVTKINEVSCILRSTLKLADDTEMKIESPFLDELGVSSCKQRVISSMAIQPNLYNTEVTFVGIDERMAQKIRKIQRYKAR